MNLELSDEQELLRIIQSLTDATTRVNDNVQGLLEIVKELHQRVTRLEEKK